MASPSIRIPTSVDGERIKQIAVDAKMFGADDVGFFDDLLSGFINGSLAEHHWLVIEDSQGKVIAAANYAPEPFGDRVWNVYFIAVAPGEQGRGFGGALIRHVERELGSQGVDIARILIIETSSTDQYARARAFYRNHGYVEEARIREFYGPDDDKVVFWKSLAASG